MAGLRRSGGTRMQLLADKFGRVGVLRKPGSTHHVGQFDMHRSEAPTSQAFFDTIREPLWVFRRLHGLFVSV